LGGYHLAGDATNDEAVKELRQRKHRDEKPFAVMVKDVAAVEKLCHINPEERRLLFSPECPIVLLRKRAALSLSPDVAPGNPQLGIMLPYTPLHHLLLAAVKGLPLVMTSGNRSDEPIAYENRDAHARLSGIADIYLTHDRPIHVRCDDSVGRVVDGVESIVRRSRGYAPRPIALPVHCPRPIAALGGQLKSTFALGHDNQAILSHHLGDLDYYSAFQAFERDLELYQKLFGISPDVIACDQHPDYVTTRLAAHLAGLGKQVLTVQHHHAHLAACMAEHGLDGQVIGVTFDGTGYGADGTIWGGEFLVGDYRSFKRAAYLRPVAMPGGDRAVREPWRMAIAHLADAGVTCRPVEARLLHSNVRLIHQMLERRLNCPITSSAGRLFDAVAVLTGLRDQVTYEGQAAQELEWLAQTRSADGAYPFELAERKEPASTETAFVFDTRPIIQAVAGDVERGVEAGLVARRFHSTLVEAITATCLRIQTRTGLDRVALSGGVFQSVLLTSETGRRLIQEGFRVYRHRLVPPNDGGLSLGQLAVAAARLQNDSTCA
jgi:hydrogenase maturation protein HypF